MNATPGSSPERIFAVAARREAPYFTDAERAALALAEIATRLSDRAEVQCGDDGAGHQSLADHSFRQAEGYCSWSTLLVIGFARPFVAHWLERRRGRCNLFPSQVRTGRQLGLLRRGRRVEHAESRGISASPHSAPIVGNRPDCNEIRRDRGGVA
jgi:hypothetical protein